MNRVSIFASGNGTNALNIIEFFKDHKKISVVALFCNKTDAPVVANAKAKGIQVEIFDKNEFYNTDNVLNKLKFYNTGFIALAGFLWLVPENILNAYTSKIINIHPALLPKYGGKGMYGMNVHKAVLSEKEKETGITIHLIDKEFDKGKILFQAKCSIDPENNRHEQIAEKVRMLEHKFYPGIIEEYILSNVVTKQ